MGLFDTVLGAVSGHVQQQGGLTQVITGLLDNNSELGGIQGLMAKFDQAGLGELIQSWIGNGENLPISGEQMSRVLGSDVVKNIASQLGMDPEQASGQLAQLLPGLINQFTPQGNVPAEGLGNAGDLMGMLGGFLGR